MSTWINIHALLSSDENEEDLLVSPASRYDGLARVAHMTSPLGLPEDACTSNAMSPAECSPLGPPSDASQCPSDAMKQAKCFPQGPPSFEPPSLSKLEEDPSLARTEPQSPKKPKNSEAVSPAHENDSQHWSEPDQGDHPGPDGSLKEIDEQADPPVEASPLALEMCSYERLSSLIVREHEARSDEGLRKGVREVLREMETSDLSDVLEREAADQKFLDEVKEHILDAEQFVAGSFKNNLAAWEELLQESKRQSSQKVLKWIKEGVQPTFEGT